MLSKLRLRTRLFAAFGLMAFFCLGAGLLNLWSIRQLNVELDVIVHHNLPELRASLEADMAHDASRGSMYRAVIGFHTANPAETAEGLKEFQQNVTSLRQMLRQITATNATPVVVAGVRETDAATVAYQKSGDALGVLLQQRAGAEKVASGLQEFQLHFDRLAEAMQKVTNAVEKNVHATDAEATAVMSRSSGVSILSTLLAVCTAVVLALMLDRQISHPLSRAVTHLESASLQVSAASTQITSNGQSLAESTSEQAASLEETSASLEEISAMTKRNAESASRSRGLSQEARESAATGLERISTMGRTLTTVKGAVGQMESAVSEMQSSSQEIAKIIKTIDEIAFQTNLLALNAAVEAARAGEAGAGFAVVADEVRSLAQRSAQAAKDTSEKIEAAIRRSEFGGVASAKVVQSLGEMESNAASIGQAFQGIVKQIASLDEVIAHIASASQEQSSGIAEVNMAVTQMDKVTQTNAASAQENAAAAHELKRQAQSLRVVVAELHALVAGASALAAASEPHASGFPPLPAASTSPHPLRPTSSLATNGHAVPSAKRALVRPTAPTVGVTGYALNGDHANGHATHGAAPAKGSTPGEGLPPSRLPSLPGGFRDF